MYKLYGRKGAGSVSVQVLLEEAKAPYEAVWVEDLKAPTFLAVNPNGKVPALQLPGGAFMYESAAMMAYLAEALPTAKLCPASGTPEKGRFLQWMAFISSGIYETVLRFFYSDRYGEEKSVKAAAGAELDRLYGVIEAELAKQGPFLCGKDISAADLYLTMLANWYDPSFDALVAKFPKVGALCQTVTSRPSWQKVQAANA